MLRKNRSVIVIVLLIVVFALVVTVSIAQEKVEKDTLTVVIIDDINTLDPNDSVSFPHHQVTRQIYETLFVRDENMELVPWLAESWEYEDDETIICKIRKGVYFHNGDELKASDVLFTFKRCYADNSTAVMQLKGINVDKSEVIDDYTLKIVTDGPAPMQPALIEHPSACIISERAYNESDGNFFEAPVGTGPYKLVSYRAGDRIVLEANDDYWIKDQPHIKNVIFRIVSDSSSRAIEAEAGGADIVVDIGANDVDRISANKNINLVSAMGMNTSYLNFNTAKPPLDNILVRKAVWYGVDVARAIEVAYGNYGQVADGFLSPGVEGRYPDLSDWFVERDVEKAKALLAEAGYPDGITLHISCENSNQQRMDFCEATQAQLAEVGITLVLDFLEVNTWVQELITGRGELSVYGLTASTGEAARTLFRWLPTMSETKIWSFYDQELMDVINEFMVTINVDRRNELFYRAQEILMENFVALPIWHKEINAAIKPDVKGFRLMPTFEQHYLQHVYFE